VLLVSGGRVGRARRAVRRRGAGRVCGWWVSRVRGPL